MRQWSSWSSAAVPILMVAVGWACVPSAWGQAVAYDGASGILTLPSVQVGTARYTNVQLHNKGDFTFELLGATPASAVGLPLATYDIPSGVLTLPSVALGTQIYRAALQDIGNYTFHLTSASLLLTAQFVDGPTNGLVYASAPSGASGITSGNGFYGFSPGDSVTFSLWAGGNTAIGLGTATPGSLGAVTFVSSLPHGQQIAEIIQALDHGNGPTTEVGNLTIPDAVVAQINAYIATDGTDLAGFGSDDQFLAHVQAQASAPTPFRHAVTGTGKTFLQNTVLPNLQASVTALSLSNTGAPTGPVASTTYAGSLTESAAVQIPPQNGCGAVNVTASGGAILNAVVNGNLQVPGNYVAQVSGGTFGETSTFSGTTCDFGAGPQQIPGLSSSDSVAAFAGVVNIVSDGTNLVASGPLIGGTPAGCVGGDTAVGTVIGLSNPMVTLTSVMQCNIDGAIVNSTLTVKMIGSF
jgi:hypothetical protein